MSFKQVAAGLGQKLLKYVTCLFGWRQRCKGTASSFQDPCLKIVCFSRYRINEMFCWFGERFSLTRMSVKCRGAWAHAATAKYVASPILLNHFLHFMPAMKSDIIGRRSCKWSLASNITARSWTRMLCNSSLRNDWHLVYSLKPFTERCNPKRVC